MPTHIKAARNALLFYIAEKKDASFVDGKMIFLQGSPVLEDKNGVKLGRLSGIVARRWQKHCLCLFQNLCHTDTYAYACSYAYASPETSNLKN